MKLALSLTFVLLGLAPSGGLLDAQAVKWRPPKDLPPPPLTYRGLIPGVSTVEELRRTLGEPLHEASWYAYKMVYAAPGRPGHLDAFHLESRDGKSGRLGNIESASVPAGWETLGAVKEKLGEPEFHLDLHRAALLDYSERGLRFVFDPAGRAIGIAHVPHGKTRVHVGERRFLSLRHLRQGPQPAPAAEPPLGGLRAGAAEVDITPRTPEWLGPAAKKGTFTVHDPLKARCAVLERDGMRVAFVGADLFGMSLSEIAPIEARLRERGIAPLILAMSHNHAAADTIGIYGHFPQDYVAFLQERIAEGVLAAAAKLAPVKRWVAASDELALDGARVQGLIRNARNPGILDPQLAVMQAQGEDRKPIVTFVHFACHVEGLENGILETSADFPGYLCDALAKDVGGQVVFLNGALGGMVSGDTLARTHAESAKAGKRFAEEAARLLRSAVAPPRMDFVVERRRVEIPLTNAKFILFMQMANRRELVRGRIAAEMFYLRLGEAELVTIPGELLPELSFEILERMRGYPRLIVGLVNDELGYLIPGYDFNAGEYEEGMSVGPAGGPMVRDLAIRMLEEAWEPQRFRAPR
jgi:hypothetical protein